MPFCMHFLRDTSLLCSLENDWIVIVGIIKCKMSLYFWGNGSYPFKRLNPTCWLNSHAMWLCHWVSRGSPTFRKGVYHYKAAVPHWQSPQTQTVPCLCYKPFYTSTLLQLLQHFEQPGNSKLTDWKESRPVFSRDPHFTVALVVKRNTATRRQTYTYIIP